MGERNKREPGSPIRDWLRRNGPQNKRQPHVIGQRWCKRKKKRQASLGTTRVADAPHDCKHTARGIVIASLKIRVVEGAVVVVPCKIHIRKLKKLLVGIEGLPVLKPCCVLLILLKAAARLCDSTTKQAT